MSGRATLLVVLVLWVAVAARTPAIHDPGPIAELATRSVAREGEDEPAAVFSFDRSDRLGLDEVTAVAATTGLRGEELAMAVAIAGWDGAPSSAESGGQACAQGDRGLANATWGHSVGLWQIRSLRDHTSTGDVRDAERLCDPAFNAQSMLAIYRERGDWTPWGAYTDGRYRPNLDQARTATREWS